MGTTNRVSVCPRDEKEWQRASHRLNCSSDARNPINRYHCLPLEKLTTLVELCYNETRIQLVKGTKAVKYTEKQM